ncbi:BTAD domain-containing putative transcriptional regulator [Novosphingobium sediminis]|uniref:BTAD domain-containing putative transcriptional regulator n=1 Tax=Novosphingobium sediminis TaxID=707214 RepID=UPI001478DDC9|nr:BTAD domain-containing putative transcriptional regulator [Novosphingobium sediminis]
MTTELGRDAAAIARFHVQLIGPFRLAGPDRAAIPIQGRRTRALLATLLLAPEQTMGRERLAGLFWGDRSDAQARASLRQCLLELRGVLSGSAESDGDHLIATRETVTLFPGAFACDVLAVRGALASHDWEEAARLIDGVGAAPLLQDLELGGAYGEWLDVARAEIDARMADGLARHIAAREEAGDSAGVKALAAAWLRRDPLSETAVAALIRAEIATGARAAAHIRYQAFRDLLAAEIGVAPGPLVDAALRSEALVAEPLVVAAPVSPPATPLPAPANDGLVLAVLAFDNLSSDPELADFCDGVSEEIQRTVARGTGIAVVARASSFQFRGPDKSIAKVAAALGASHLLDGSVRRSGQRLRITAELVECASHRAVWSERFDGDLEDVFALQDSIAEKVAAALELTLLPSTPIPTLAPATYERFLRARGLLADGDAQFDNTASDAVPLLEMVVRDAPDHAPAWELLALARAQVLRGGRGALPYAEAREAVIEAAQTALKLDPRRGGAYRALAMLEPWGHHAVREKLLLQALEVAPRDPAALTDMSNFCWGVGRFRDALAYAEQACELNPLMPAARLHVAQMRAYVGDYDTSVSMLEEVHQRWPNNAGILMALLNWAGSLGYPEVYYRNVSKIDQFDGWQARDLAAVRSYVEAVFSRDMTVKETRAARYRGLLEQTGTITLSLPTGLGFIGLPDMAFELVELADYSHVFDPAGPSPSLFYPGVALGPWSCLLSHPRFIRVCHRLGLCRYWQETGQWPDCAAWVPFDFKSAVRRAVDSGPAPGE